MHKQIIVNSTPNEVRVALMEDHEVVEFSMERADNRRVVGNVYKGVVTAVRPGLQAAFVEIGMEKAGFLHVSDLIHDSPDDDDDRGGRGGRRRRRGREGMRPIETMLKEGDEILVQVTKEIIGTKGPRLTADISLPGRFMVLMPKGDHVGVSRKIEDRRERHRLRDLLSGLKPDDEGGAFIIRTAAVGIEGEMLKRDMDYLRRMYKEIQEKAHTMPAPALVHQDVGLLVGMIRDIFKDDIDRVEVDSRDDYQELMQYVKNFSPELRDRIHLYEGDVPIFDRYGIEQELKKSLERKVWMKRGGFLVIDEAEALVAIDVNTGRYTGKKNQAETIFKTNMLAAKEIARQLRLRDIGGIIVCDFIDMESEEDKRRVLAELRSHLKRDRARTKTFPVTELGLVEMSRQRVQQSLKDRLSEDCPYCRGAGQVLSTETLANKVENLLLKLAATRNEKAVQVRANPTLALVLMSERASAIQNIARTTGIRIDVVDDPRLHREEFQIISTQRRKDLVAETERSAVGDGRGQQQERRSGKSDGERRRRGSRGDERTADAGEERGGRRRRRGRRDGEDSARVADDRSRGGSGDRKAADSRRTDEDSTEPTRSSRGRRRRSETRRDDASAVAPREPRPAEVDETAGSAAAAATGAAAVAPESGEEERPRRRRRRGRRGGRGRRRARENAENPTNEENQVEAGGSADAPGRTEAPAPVTPQDAVEAPSPTEDRATSDAPSASNAAEVASSGRDSESPAADTSASEPTRRTRRIRRRRSSESGDAASVSADRSSREDASSAPADAAADAPAPREDTAPRARGGSDSDDRSERGRRGRGRRRASVRDGETPPPSTSPIASPEEYVRPIPEEQYLREKAEAEQRQEERRADASSPIQPAPDTVTQDVAAPASQAPASGGDDSESGERRVRRRRRVRRVTRPTPSIGAKSPSSDED